MYDGSKVCSLYQMTVYLTFVKQGFNSCDGYYERIISTSTASAAAAAAAAQIYCGLLYFKEGTSCEYFAFFCCVRIREKVF
jgi:hypothetical protein